MQTQNEKEIDEENSQEVVENNSVRAVNVDANTVVPGYATSMEAIKNRLNEIDQNYQGQLDDIDRVEPVLTPYVENMKPSQGDIDREARDDVIAEQATYEEKVVEKYQPKLDALDIKVDKINTALETTKENLSNDLVQRIEKNNAELIKQGLERSSIATNSQEGYVSSYEKELQEQITKANQALDEINLKRSVVKNEMNNALEQFNIAYASELEEKINQLTEQYNQKYAEIEKTNQQIAKIRRDELQEWSIWANTARNEINAKKGYEKAVYIIDLMKDLNKSELLEILKDAEIKESLGGWYNVIVDYINRVK